jgi:hypothetical protein
LRRLVERHLVGTLNNPEEHQWFTTMANEMRDITALNMMKSEYLMNKYKDHFLQNGFQKKEELQISLPTERTFTVGQRQNNNGTNTSQMTFPIQGQQQGLVNVPTFTHLPTHPYHNPYPNSNSFRGRRRGRGSWQQRGYYY